MAKRAQPSRSGPATAPAEIEATARLARRDGPRPAALVSTARAKAATASGPRTSQAAAGDTPSGDQGALGQGAGSPAKRQAARAAAMAASAYPRPRGAGPLFGTVDFPLKRHVSPHGQVTAVSMMKDEGPFVLEWVAHHLALGFSDLLVYTNDCSDGTDDMLIRLEELGLVHHRRNVIAAGIRPQPSALSHAEAEPVVQLSDWVMVFDADEFLSIRHGDGSLDGLIGAAKAEGANGIVITWRIFGSGGVVGWSRAPVTEQYLQAAPPDWNKGWGVKTLFQYDPDVWKLGIHRPKLKSRVLKTDVPDQVRWLNGSGREMEDYFKFRGWRSITRTVGYDWVQLNHYAVKSVESYALRKLRGNVNNKADKYNSDYWSLQDRNEIRDETMLRYSAKRGEIFAQLLQDPVLSALHAAALARVETRLADLRPTQAYADLLADLDKASRVPIGEIVAKPPQPRDPAKIAALMSDVEKLRAAKAKAERKAAAAAQSPEDKAAKSASAPPAGRGLTRLYASEAGAGTVSQSDWVANQGVLLPLDQRLFSAASLQLVAKGKFERSLARLLPDVIPQGARVLDHGAGLGFLALVLAQKRPDLRLSLHEGEAGLAAALEAVLARNGALCSGGAGQIAKARGEGLAAQLAELDPQALLLGAGGLSRADLGAALQSHRPQVLVLHGRALEAGPSEGDLADLASQGDALADLGYRPLPRALPQALGFTQAPA